MISGSSPAQRIDRIQKKDPPSGSIIYTMGITEFRLRGSYFWDASRALGNKEVCIAVYMASILGAVITTRGI